MIRWIWIGLGSMGALLAAGLVAAAIAAVGWNRATAAAIGRLRGAALPRAIAAPLSYSRNQIAGLPAPVVRYFEFALTPGQRLVHQAQLRWVGDFLARPPSGWYPFTATQHYAVFRPGFVWDANIRMMPLFAMRVRDGYAEGEGAMLGKLAALVRLVDLHDTPEMATGALSRYLAEAVWFPTALLPSAGVVWSSIDDSSARATLVDGRNTVSVDFHFGADGAIVGASMERHRDVNGRMVLTPWDARMIGAYQRALGDDGGPMIPTTSEAAWVTPAGRLPYWRGRPVEVEYEYAPPRSDPDRPAS